MAEVQEFINNLVGEFEATNKGSTSDDFLRHLRQKLMGPEYHVDLNWRDFSDLYIINVSNKSKLETPFVRKCNGVVLDQNTNKIVCYSFPVFMNEEDYPTDPKEPLQVESMYDGTLMKLFYHPTTGKWETATTKCFDASRSRWSSKKSFHELFMDTLGANFNFNALDKKKCYIGLLIHPENKLVSDYFVEGGFKEATFVHTGTCNLETLEFETDYEKLPSDAVILPEKKEFANLEALTTFLKEEDFTQPVRPGFVCLVGEDRYKFMAPNYNALKDLRGNIQNMKYRLLEMQGNETKIKKFLEHFPEYKDLDAEVKADIENLGKNVYRNYASYYFKHEKSKRYPDDIFDAIKAVNWKYKEDLEKVDGDRSRITTDPSTISYFLVTRYPFEKLVGLLGYRENTNRQVREKTPVMSHGPPTGGRGHSGPPRGPPTGGRGHSGPPRGPPSSGRGRSGPPRGPPSGGRGHSGPPRGPPSGGRGHSGPPRGSPSGGRGFSNKSSYSERSAPKFRK